MKVLHYISKFSLPSEYFVYSLLRNLDASGFCENVVLTHRRELSRERPYSGVLLEPDESLLDKVWRNLRGKTYLELKRKRAIFSRIKEQAPDIVHAHFGIHGVLMYNLFKSMDARCNLVVSFHGSDLTSMPRVIPEYRDSLVEMASCDWVHFTVQSRFLFDRLSEIIGSNDRIHFINNACPESNSRLSDAPRRKPGGTGLKIINVGRLTEVKGQIYLIEAFAKLLERLPDAELIMVGSGRERRALVKRIRGLGLSKKVKLVPALRRDDLLRLMAQQDVFVLPSVVTKTYQEESFGMVVLEAMSVGLPVIGSNIGGVSEVIREDSKFGFLVEQKNTDALVDALLRVSEVDYTKETNEEYAAPIFACYSEAEQLKRIKGLYDNLLRA